MTSALGSVPCPDWHFTQPCRIALFTPLVEMVRSECVSAVFIGKLAAQTLESSGALFKIPDQIWDLLGVW